MSSREEHPVLIDGHRVCAYCDGLERPTWNGTGLLQPWLCCMCLGRATVDSDFAHRVAQQLYYQCMELEPDPSALSVQVALKALQTRWLLLPSVVTPNVTQPGELRQVEDELPF